MFNKFKYAPLLLMLCNYSAHAGEVSNWQLATANEYVQSEMQKRHEIIAGRSLALPKIIYYDSDYIQMGMYSKDYIFLPSSYGDSYKPFLIHELVHYYQDNFHLQYKCRNAMEREAYEIQNKYAISYDLPNRVVPQKFIDKMREYVK